MRNYRDLQVWEKAHRLVLSHLLLAKDLGLLKNSDYSVLESDLSEVMGCCPHCRQGCASHW